MCGSVFDMGQAGGEIYIAMQYVSGKTLDDAKINKIHRCDVRVIEPGVGGMGKVLLAWDRELARYTALKFIREKQDEETIAMFRREARTAARLNHPDIASVYDMGQAGGEICHQLGRRDQNLWRHAPVIGEP